MDWAEILAAALALANAVQLVLNRKLASAQRKLTEAQAALTRAQAANVEATTLRAVVEILSDRLGDMVSKREVHAEWDDAAVEVLRDSGAPWSTPPPLY